MLVDCSLLHEGRRQWLLEAPSLSQLEMCLLVFLSGYLCVSWENTACFFLMTVCHAIRAFGLEGVHLKIVSLLRGQCKIILSLVQQDDAPCQSWATTTANSRTAQGSAVTKSLTHLAGKVRFVLPLPISRWHREEFKQTCCLWSQSFLKPSLAQVLPAETCHPMLFSSDFSFPLSLFIACHVLYCKGFPYSFSSTSGSKLLGSLKAELSARQAHRLQLELHSNSRLICIVRSHSVVYKGKSVSKD